MTRSHRRAHVWAWFAVGAFAGAAFVAYFAERLGSKP